MFRIILDTIVLLVDIFQKSFDLFLELLRSTEIRNDLNAKFESVVINVLFGLALSTNDTKGLYNDIKKDYLLDKDYVNVSNPASVQAFIDVSNLSFFYFSTYLIIV